MDQITTFVDPLKVFVKDSVRLVKRCTKPDRKGINVQSFSPNGQNDCTLY